MITIGDNTFKVPAPKGMTSFALQQRILPVAGRVANVFLHLVGASSAADLGNLLEADVLRVLPEAMPHVGEIFAQMPQGELEAITRALLAGATTTVGNTELPLFGSPKGEVFDQVLQGRTMDTWKLLWHALGVWYPDFFGLAQGFLVKANGAKRSAVSTISPTSGPAGA